MKILSRCSAWVVLACVLTTGCTVPSHSPAPTTPTPPPSPAASDGPSAESFEGEFVAINLYRTTSIEYRRGLRMDDGAVIVLTSSDPVPYERIMSVESGMLSEIRFHLTGQTLAVACSVKEYAMGVELQEVSLPDGKTTAYVGRSGIRVRVVGTFESVQIPGLQGWPVLSVAQCDRLE